MAECPSLLLARSLLRDRAPGFLGDGADPVELEQPLDADVPDDFTADVDHPALFHLDPTPLATSHDRASGSPEASIQSPPAAVEGRVPMATANARASSDAAPEEVSSNVILKSVDEIATVSGDEAEGIDEDDEDNDIGSREDDEMAVTDD
ncbi:hypothetical protein EUX98_g8716 [Antrodiella citrinella]|uniref:Uncharacterized protein n=1 Tax=Antrodiella citrinella TaxID=2447956 RepID=A0A4S4M3Q1_9APHY|nr:hypothetical protein EUX98_g8716 [Antrodiella citrinella]